MLDYKHVAPLGLLLLSIFIINNVMALDNGLNNYNLYMIKGVIEPHKSLEYRFQVDVAGYTVFRIRVFDGEGVANGISLRILLDGNEYGNYTLLRGRNELYGWGWLKQGNYVLILTNNLGKEILVHGYVLVFRCG